MREPPDRIDVNQVRNLVNQSQRQGISLIFLLCSHHYYYAVIGAHTPQGRVTALPLPTVQRAPAFSRYQVPAASKSAPSLLVVGSSSTAVGYSSEHVKYAEERRKWSGLAYRGKNQVVTRESLKNEVCVLIMAWYTMLGDKYGKTVCLIFIVLFYSMCL